MEELRNDSWIGRFIRVIRYIDIKGSFGVDLSFVACRRVTY
jgi:hypothetical protein